VATPSRVPAANPPSRPAASAPPSPACAGNAKAANGSDAVSRRTLTVFRKVVSPRNTLPDGDSYAEPINGILTLRRGRKPRYRPSRTSGGGQSARTLGSVCFCRPNGDPASGLVMVPPSSMACYFLSFMKFLRCLPSPGRCATQLFTCFLAFDRTINHERAAEWPAWPPCVAPAPST
jgi:hypothetical protein